MKQMIEFESKFCSTKTVMELWLDFFHLKKRKKNINSEKEMIWFDKMFSLEDYHM